MMSRGRLLAEAARLADEAHRMIVRASVNLDAADATISSEAEIEIAELLEDSAAFADELLRVADEYGHAQVARRFPARRAAA